MGSEVDESLRVKSSFRALALNLFGILDRVISLPLQNITVFKIDTNYERLSFKVSYLVWSDPIHLIPSNHELIETCPD